VVRFQRDQFWVPQTCGSRSYTHRKHRQISVEALSRKEGAFCCLVHLKMNMPQAFWMRCLYMPLVRLESPLYLVARVHVSEPFVLTYRVVRWGRSLGRRTVLTPHPTHKSMRPRRRAVLIRHTGD